jgi:hypothetical protein
MGNTRNGSQFAERINNRHAGLPELVSSLEAEGLAGFVILQTKPQLRNYVQYRDAQQSLEQSRLSAQRELIEQDDRDYPLLSE